MRGNCITFQMDYVGVIKPLFANGVSGTGDGSGDSNNSLPAELPYSATSLVDHRITLQRGDAVSFFNVNLFIPVDDIYTGIQ